MAAYKDYTSICNSAPSENLAILALQHKEKLVERNLQIVKRNVAILNIFFEKYAKYFQWVRL
jgi:aspartate/methionine/tyrosine aminotransferase